jgi:hypothetical protein
MAITVKHLKVSAIPDAGDATLVQPSDWNSDHTLTGLGTMAEQNANAVAITGGTMSGVTVTGYIPTTQKAAALGVATLDAGGTVPLSQIPASIQGGVSYQGTWNASTNTPTLSNGVGTKGYYYVVSVAGSTNLDGITAWNVGDWAIFNGTVWQKVDNTDAVTSVNGYTGTVVLTNTDISGFGTMSTQNANSVAITGGAIDGTTIGATTTSTGKFTTLNASTSLTTPTVQASNSGGLSLKNASGTTQMSMGAGGGDNMSINVSTNLNGTNAQIDISPTGTGHVHINPTGSGSIEMNPTSAGTINNMVIGGTTPKAITGTTITATTFSGSGASLTSIPNSALVNSAITINGTNTSLGGSISVGTVTSVGLTAPAMFTVSGSPVTGTGTLALSYSGTALPVANGGTARTVGNYSVFANEIHVSKDGNDTTGDGTLINPVLTITKALTLIAGLKKTIIVHAGDYPESPTVSTANTTIATSELTGANTTISGTLTLSAAARVSGIKISNLTITGSGSTYISNCTVDTQVVKSGTNYVEIINSELQCVSGIQITGAGTVSIVGNKCWGVTVSNASANVLIKDCFQVLTPSVTAGSLQFDGSAIFASSPASNAVTSSAGSFITLANSFVLNSAGNSVERVSLAGSYSILNLVYDKTNSTFTGTNLNAIDYFSVVNADTLVLTNDLAIAYGGTNSSATPTAGAVPYGTGTAYGFSAAGTAGQVLTSQGAGTPTWTTPTTGTVTSVGGTGTVSGISLSGTVTSSGNLTLGGTLDLSSPPAIGGTAPNTVAGTVIQATNGIVVNSNTVSASYSIPSGSSASSVGPMTVASGQTVTVPSGSRWVVL